jgi:hypothetical protein
MALRPLTQQDAIWGEAIDAMVFMAIMQRITKPISTWDAKKLGLIDNIGNIIREPQTPEERRALTTLDRFILEFLRVGRGRVPNMISTYRRLRSNPDFVRSRNLARGLKFFNYYRVHGTAY